MLCAQETLGSEIPSCHLVGLPLTSSPRPLCHRESFALWMLWLGCILKKTTDWHLGPQCHNGKECGDLEEVGSARKSLSHWGHHSQEKLNACLLPHERSFQENSFLSSEVTCA